MRRQAPPVQDEGEQDVSMSGHHDSEPGSGQPGDGQTPGPDTPMADTPTADGTTMDGATADGATADLADADLAEAEVERLVGALIDDVHRVLTRIFDRRMARLEMTRAQWRVLTFLIRQDGMTQSALAELLEMERAPLGRLVDRLEESGWVERRGDPGDKRAKRVYRTAKIDPFLSTLKDDAHDVLSMALDGVPRAARLTLIHELSRVKANLQAAEGRVLKAGDAAFPKAPGPGKRYSDL